MEYITRKVFLQQTDCKACVNIRATYQRRILSLFKLTFGVRCKGELITFNARLHPPLPLPTPCSIFPWKISRRTASEIITHVERASSPFCCSSNCGSQGVSCHFPLRSYSYTDIDFVVICIKDQKTFSETAESFSGAFPFVQPTHGSGNILHSSTYTAPHCHLDYRFWLY